MASKSAVGKKIDYSILARFTELLICSRCFQNKVRRPVRQLVSGRHRPLALCHDCTREHNSGYKAPVVRMKPQFHY